MLKDAPVMVTISVDDLTKAKQFYTTALGLEVDDTNMPGMLLLKVKGADSVALYEKKNHQPATYTVLNFTVNNLEEAMKELEAKGVKFERYDLPDIKTDERGIADYGMMKIAFFNDPAGNNHAVMQMTGK